MLRSHLEDAALLAAKAWSHARVEPRHVGYAIATHLSELPGVADLLPPARAALEPRGFAVEVPTLTDEAKALLDSIGSPEGAVEALRTLLAGGVSGAGPERGPAESGAAAATAGADPRTSSGAEEADDPRTDARPDAAAEETVAEVLADLDALVGLDGVKEQVKRVIAVVQANRERAAAGLPTVNPGLHLVFSGAPGTGKTTVARIMARLYAASGALPGSNFTEVGRADLVAGYVGQTALQTSAVIRKTLPGVLFIDEAYALRPTHESDFGHEAISTLVKAMEDHRHRLAVIVAGYAREMSDFLSANPGLRSRLKTFVNFPDYGPKELVEIFAGFVNATGLHLSDAALEKAEGVFEQAVRRADFGNARFARSLFEGAYARMATRAAADGTVEMEELLEFLPDDLEWNEPDVEVNVRRIGFGESDDE